MVSLLKRFSSPSLSTHSSLEDSFPPISLHGKIALCAFPGYSKSIAPLVFPSLLPSLAWILLHIEAGIFSSVPTISQFQERRWKSIRTSYKVNDA